ncbi:MAG: FliI/YscN family ATPase [Gammaproteobacteria bacterium]|nr:FliI/YscN family ATPase [Gammaproteobacteria bacterium]
MIGLTMEATGCSASIGSKCHVSTHTGFVDAKVVGFSEDKLFLMPFDEIQGLTVGAQVLPVNQKFDASVGDGLLGRIIDAAGEPIDELGPISGMARRSIQAEPINPLQRTLINQPLDVGVRAINGLLTVGRGQRMGLIAGSGVGKSQLLGMMSRHTEADVTVIGMIGERGREVKAFVDNILGSEGLANSVVVAVPADNTAVRRLHGAMLATTIAEHFRDQGKHVLLLMDSLTRFAQAQREIGLAIGEPPTTKGYPPSVFKLLPQLVERAGYGASGGSVTAIYTLLAEGDDQNDPVVDAARAVLDGHIVLSREVAESGVYPAIDLEASVSRLANDLADQQQLKAIGALRRLYGLYKQNENLINMGVYQAGSNSDVDQAIRAWPNIQSYIRQALSESSNRTESINSLLEIIHSLDAVATV